MDFQIPNRSINHYSAAINNEFIDQNNIYTLPKEELSLVSNLSSLFVINGDNICLCPENINVFDIFSDFFAVSPMDFVHQNSSPIFFVSI
jgi:hypothetical protein